MVLLSLLEEKGISFDTQEDLDVEEHKVRSFLEVRKK